MIKIDLCKAYDYMEWSFLEEMLVSLGFPGQFMDWIMKCVTTMSYSILVNGEPAPPFKARKGLWQGNPMSLYLFALAME